MSWNLYERRESALSPLIPLRESQIRLHSQFEPEAPVEVDTASQAAQRAWTPICYHHRMMYGDHRGSNNMAMKGTPARAVDTGYLEPRWKTVEEKEEDVVVIEVELWPLEMGGGGIDETVGQVGKSKYGEPMELVQEECEMQGELGQEAEAAGEEKEKEQVPKWSCTDSMSRVKQVLIAQLLDNL